MDHDTYSNERNNSPALLCVICLVAGIIFGLFIGGFPLSSPSRPAASYQPGVAPPQRGERWQLDCKDGLFDPWECGSPPTQATILDVKQGWVKYTLGSTFEQRRPLADFLRMYTRVAEEGTPAPSGTDAPHR